MDNSDQKLMLASEQYQFLAELDDAIRSLIDPKEITNTAAGVLGRHLGVNRCAYAHVNNDQDTFVVTGNYTNGVASIDGEYKSYDFGTEFVRLSRLGLPYVVVDTESDPRVKDVQNAYRLTGIRAVISVPVIKAGQFVAGMAVHQAIPRQWQESEVRLLEIVANRCWESIERNRIAIELRRAEERIRGDRDYLRLLINCAEEGFYSVDGDGTTIMCNTAFLKLLGFANEDEVVGKKLHDVIHHSHPDGSHYRVEDCPIYAAAKHGKPAYVQDEMFFRKDGSSFPVEYRARPVWRDGRLEGAVCTFSDLTDRRQTEKALQKSQAHLESIFEQTAAGNCEVDLTGRILRVNDRFCEIVARTREELLTLRMQEITHPDDLPRNLPLFRKTVASGEPFEIEKRYIRPDGSIVWVNNSVSLIRTAGDVPSATILAVTIDVTARKEAEAALSESETKYRELFSNMVEEVHFWEVARDAQGQIVTWRLKDANPPALKTWGRSLDEIRGKTTDEIFGPGASEHYLPIVENVFRENAPHAYEDYLPSLGRHFRFTTVPLGDHFITTGADITAIKRAIEENERLLAQLRETDRRKDEFLAMLAHELRNPLAPILAAAELMEMVQLDAARLKQTSHVISRQVRHMTGLVDDLLDVSRVTRGLIKLEQVDLDIKHVIADAIEQVRPIVEGKHHRLSMDLDPEPAHVLGDQKRLVQILTNLLNNAAKFTPERGSLHLSMQTVDGHVILRVNDNGPGISPELQSRIFDLFTQGERSSDRSQGGLGIGLSLVKSLVELHGGTVTVKSDGPKKGSEFSVTLPRLLKQHESSDKRHDFEKGIAAGRKKRILVVDDNTDAAEMLAMYLEVVGHQVFVEHDSRLALERAKTLLPDVCILDIGLPEIDGFELARLLKADPETAGIKLIAVTGYAKEQDRQSAISAGFEHHLAKPVEAGKLLKILS